MRMKYWIGVVATIMIAGALQAQTQGAKTPPGAGWGYGHGGAGCPGAGQKGPGAMGPDMGPGGGYGRGGFGMLNALNLTDRQRKEVGKIVDGHQKRRYELMGKNLELQSRLRNLYGQEKWDADAIAKVNEEMAKIHGDVVRSRVEARNKIYDLLTPDQRRQYRQWGDPVTE